MRKIFNLILMAQIFFRFALPTEGVSIYSIKDGKAYILLGKEKCGWTDFTGKFDKLKDFPMSLSVTEYTSGAAREAHEESMGVFLYPDKDDPEPEANVDSGKNFFLNKFLNESSSFCVKAIDIQGVGYTYKNSVWFVKVDYKPKEHFSTVRSKLLARSLKSDYLEKEEFQWFPIESLVFPNQIKVGELSPVFKQTIESTGVQAELKKLQVKTNLESLKTNLESLKTNLESLKTNLESLKTKLGALNEGPYLTLVDHCLVEQSFPEKERAAIVNAANEELYGGGGIDGAIWDKVGAANKKAFKEQNSVLRCKKYKMSHGEKIANPWRGDIDPINDGSDMKYAAGDAGLIKALGDLANKVSYVIQTVGPYGIDSDREKILKDVYKNCLDRANEAKLKVIAFCPISAGAYGYAIGASTPVAIDAIVEWIKDHKDSGIEEIRLVTFSKKEEEYKAYKDALMKSQLLKEITGTAKDDIVVKQLLDQSSKPLVFCVKKS